MWFRGRRQLLCLRKRMLPVFRETAREDRVGNQIARLGQAQGMQQQ